ncbi:MAG: RNA 3'-terminal phosphate cyclase, partial [Halobacteria archaeon]|nr:RNA 3'-terminal phosphate cyclase [Halobacteria archaeon]
GAVLGGSAVGERGKPAEEVGEEAARDLIGSVESRATVDLYSGDQLVPYVALAGGEYVAPEATSHLETNVWVCGKFVENEVGTEPVDGGVEVISS